MSPHQLQRQCTVFPMMILDFDEKIRTAERCRADPAISDDALDFLVVRGRSHFLTKNVIPEEAHHDINPLVQ